MTDKGKRNIIPFVNVYNMMQLVLHIGIERFLIELTSYIKADFLRWDKFEKIPSPASHSHVGVIELMPEAVFYMCNRLCTKAAINYLYSQQR